MFGMSKSAGILFGILGLVLLFTALPLGSTALAKKADECSAAGQKPCPAFYKGPICDKGLGNIGGICRKCGGEGQLACPAIERGKSCRGGRMKIDKRCYARCGGPNQKACPKVKRGYPCRGYFAPDARRFCKPCGGAGQKPCRALKAGKRCKAPLKLIDGQCRACGALNQRACPKLAGGYPCKGALAPNKRGICKPCGGAGQAPCRALKAGKRCTAPLKLIDGLCRACGGLNQRACPKLAGGYPCKGALAPDARGVCKPCGGVGQKPCRALKAGTRCQTKLKLIDGLCRACGGPNERACPKLATGYPCRGAYAPDTRGICRPCGAKGQKACRVGKAGRQCAPDSTERGGVCVGCGGEGERACKLGDKGKPCAEGLKRGLNGRCKISVEAATKRAALAQLEAMSGDLLPAFNMARSINSDENLKSDVRSEDGEAVAAVPDNNLCPGGNYASWTLGVGAEVGVIGGVEGEVGAAFRCADHAKDRKDSKWYSSGSFSLSAGGGASAGVSLGMWKSDFNDLRGKSHGFALGIADVIANIKAVKAKSGLGNLKQVQPDLSLAIWFERRDEDGDGKDDEIGPFQGFTVTVGGAAGFDVGGSYIKATTLQFCTNDMKCTEGSWQGRLGGRNQDITVDGQTKKRIYARIGDGPRTRFDRVLPAGRKYRSDAGDIIRFRKNYKLLKFSPRGGGKGEFRKTAAANVDKAERPVARPPATIVGLDVRGIWEFTIDGATVRETVLEQGAGYLVARRGGSSRTRRYEKTGENAYRGQDGGTFRFVSPSRAIFISPDRTKVFQARKR